MSRRHDPTKARRHWVYTREEICRLFDIGESTITNWMRRGLEPIDSNRPQLFAGYKVRQFMTTSRWPEGRAPENGRLFCATCLSFKAVIADKIKTNASDRNCIELTGICMDCHELLRIDVAPETLGEIYAAARNTTGDSYDVLEGEVLQGTARNGAPIPPETDSSNLRLLYGYRVFLERNQEWDERTVDEHLRALSRMSSFLGHKSFGSITIANACLFKDELRRRRDLENESALSKSTVVHTLNRCGAFFKWLQHRPGIDLDPDLAGYFRLSRKERVAEKSEVKGTSLTFDQALCLFAAMPETTPIELRNRAIVAMFVTTGIRVAALITLRGKHVNMQTRWVNQDPREVSTKMGKHIRTYCLDLGPGLIDAIKNWARWRRVNGFGADAAFFLPDRYLQPNGIGLGFRPAEAEEPECWKSDEPVQRIIKDALHTARLPNDGISSHDFRKIQHPFLSRRGAMMVVEEVALQLNFGHTPIETIRKNYASMLENEREAILDELCRRALSDRSELELYLGYERNEITESDPDYTRAKAIYGRNSNQQLP